MTGDDTFAALTGQSQGARSAREAAEERLRGWLERPHWSGAPNPRGPLPWPESVCILAGLDPEASADADSAGWALLPGALAFYGFDAFPRDRHGLAALHALAEEHIGMLLGLHLKTMPPAKAIKAAEAAGLPVPWAKAEAESPDRRSAFRKAQEKRRHKQHEDSKKTKLTLDAGRAAFDRIHKADFAGYLHTGPKRKGNVNVSAVASEVWEAIHNSPDAPDHRTLVNYVKEWIAETKSKEECSANSESAPADV